MIKCTGTHFELVDKLQSLGKTFKVSQTTKSAQVEFDSYKYLFADSHFKNSDLGLFGQLKREVQKNIQDKNLTVPEISRSKYFEVGRFEPIARGEFLTFDNCIEFDINKAYYHSALLLGYISEDFYNRCISLPKQLRLALIGTLATQKIILNYVNGELQDYETKKDEMLRRVFFHLVEYTDKALDLFAKLAYDNFLFYWVDGIYLKDYERAETHKAIIEYEYNLKFSYEPIKQVIVYNKAEYSTQIVVKKQDDKLKTFTLNNIFVRNDKN